MRLFVGNLMSHKVAFTYYSYFDTLSLVTHTLNIPFITFSPSISCERGSPPGFHRTTVSANTGYVQATINKTDPILITFDFQSGEFGIPQRQRHLRLSNKYQARPYQI